MDWKAESARLRSERGIGEYEPLAPFVSERTVDRSLWYEGQLMTVYAQGDVVDNTCCVWEGNIPERIGPPPHIHHYEHELFFVIEGSITAWVEGAEHHAERNSLVFLPAGRIHWFVATSPATRMLSFTVTASREYPSINDNVALFRLIGVPAESMTMPPEVEVKQLPDRAEIARVNYEMGAGLPDLERLGWRRGYGEEGANTDG
ncbi:cupin domain-containing protein [Amycolatopsis sp. NBC_00345]|uniref:cupin domain-containing protein n=1 Tax=Amycolatopsis sp. NBC_00345 TaxID=2975955 RepID=UPI002E26C144